MTREKKTCLLSCQSPKMTTALEHCNCFVIFIVHVRLFYLLRVFLWLYLSTCLIWLDFKDTHWKSNITSFRLHISSRSMLSFSSSDSNALNAINYNAKLPQKPHNLVSDICEYSDTWSVYLWKRSTFNSKSMFQILHIIQFFFLLNLWLLHPIFATWTFASSSKTIAPPVQHALIYHPEWEKESSRKKIFEL